MKRGLLSILPILFVTGYGNMTIGAYQHMDMRESHYADIIKAKAISLAEDPNNTAALKISAELSGSIGELKIMDKVAESYFNQDPRSGLLLLRQCDKVHEFYENRGKQ